MWRDVVSGLLQQNLCTAMLNVLQIKQTEIHIKIFFFNDYCQRILVNGNKTSTDTNRNFIEL